MKKQLAILAIALLFVVATMSANSTRADENDADAVRAAAEKFYVALNAVFSGDVGPMKDVWSHKSDITYMGPGGGLRVGWKQVLADWESQTARKLGGEVKPEDMRITVGRDLAIVNNFEIGQNVDADGKPQKVEIRATSVFRKEDGKWKMIGHHTDLLPFLQR
jgi:ketosteroid isomerase-like protein